MKRRCCNLNITKAFYYQIILFSNHLRVKNSPFLKLTVIYCSLFRVFNFRNKVSYFSKELIWVLSTIFILVMLRKFVPIARKALSSRPSAGFCLFKAYMDPHKHNTMNHNIHNVYIELYDTGDYPEWIVNQSEPSKAYQPEVYSLIVDVLKTEHPSLTVDYLTKNNHRNWNDALRRLYPNRQLQEDKKDLNNLIQKAINKLAFNIFVKESKWTWIKEQEQRLRFTTNFFSTHQVQNIEEFVQAYNLCIEVLISTSNFGRARDIPHDDSSLQKAILSESKNEDPVGIKEIQNQPNFINRIMAFIHKI